MSAGRRSRASGTLVPKLELGNEDLKLVVINEKCQYFRNFGIFCVQVTRGFRIVFWYDLKTRGT